MFEIKDLHVLVESQQAEIIKGLNLSIVPGEIHALMGKNGSGKSTLAQTILGSPYFKVTQGSISLNGKNLLELSPDKRSLAGLFLSFQYPSEVSGVNVLSYLRMIYSKKTGIKLSPIKFRKLVEEKLELLHMKDDFTKRYLNEGFSGGEKKKMEMLQMVILEPEVVILDEVDSGLDIDSLKVVGNVVNYLYEKTKMSILVITHYARILNYIKPSKVHIMNEGKIIKSGGKEFARLLEEKGYAAVSN